MEIDSFTNEKFALYHRISENEQELDDILTVTDGNGEVIEWDGLDIQLLEKLEWEPKKEGNYTFNIDNNLYDVYVNGYPENLFAYWKLNNNVSGSGGEVNEEINNYNGVTRNGVNTGVDGVRENSFYFDGGEDVRISFDDSWNSDTLSVCAWIKTDVEQNDKHIVSSYVDGGSDSDAYFRTDLREPGNRLNVGIKINGNWYSCTEDSANRVDNKWHHIGWTYNGSLLTLFVDGEIVKECELNINLPQTERDLWIGNDGVSRYFTGNIDEVMLFHKSISKEFMNDIYNSYKI